MSGETSVLPSSNAITLQALRAAIEARVPTMLVGAPGVGKTATIRSMVKSMDYHLITLLGSQMDPTDITGLPKGEIIANDEEGNPLWGTVYLAPWWQVQIIRRKKVVLFLDEFSNTSSAVRASMLTLLQNREFPNGEKMPDETIVIGAMNPTDQAADGWELDKPTTNRLLFLVWKSPRDDWYSGMLNAWGEEVSEDETYWRRRIVSFLKDNPSFLHKENNEMEGTPEAHGVNVNDPSEAEVLRYAWSSRRSWDNLSRILAFVDRKDAALQDEIASGLVGRSSTVEFRDWILQNEIIDPAAVLRDPKMVDWANVDVSEANIIFRAVVELINVKTWRQTLTLLDVIADANAEALVTSYMTEIVQKIMAASKVGGAADVEEAKSLAKATIGRYRLARSS